MYVYVALCVYVCISHHMINYYISEVLGERKGELNNSGWSLMKGFMKEVVFGHFLHK